MAGWPSKTSGSAILILPSAAPVPEGAIGGGGGGGPGGGGFGGPKSGRNWEGEGGLGGEGGLDGPEGLGGEDEEGKATEELDWEADAVICLGVKGPGDGDRGPCGTLGVGFLGNQLGSFFLWDGV